MKTKILIWLAFILLLGVVLVYYKTVTESELKVLQSHYNQLNTRYDKLLGDYNSEMIRYSDQLNDAEAIANRIPEKIYVEVPFETVIYRYPNSPPYETFADPIGFEQAIALLEGMKASHVAVLDWTFITDPGFGLADRELQLKMIKWYDQLIDYTWIHKAD